jgi:hypothetical protein
VLETGTDPYSVFIFAMRSPKTREKCIGRLAAFFDFEDTSLFVHGITLALPQHSFSSYIICI